ncbi:Cyclin, N-terminal domain-containing protein [Fusarium solani]|uniref:Cyclin, N-terminal domain-containing protein n=1 Tax=Fusarium solani TaxID=169388 RepID=A0A9P9K552_FUSSL|nr:Cyclin, N-terminal domain-containing protein [Fusarium solani]KAH7248353.1 Cyclin, N-terminal domain-containing protein [Fusarium solani]
MAYSHDDGSFFVESDDHHPRISTQETIKMLTRQRQDMIAGELSRLAVDEPYLIDFLIEAHAVFALLPETLFLTVNLLDRYCSKRVVYKQHYQLVGCAALLIAAKYSDKKGRVPRIHELNNMCCGLYDAGMLTQMEMHVLNALDWTIGHPTVDLFFQLMVTEEGDDQEVEHMAAYFCEIAMYYRDFVSTEPSTMARSSLVLARAILARPDVNDGEWDHTENMTLLTLSHHLRQPSEILARKYSTPSYSKVSQKLAEFMAEQAELVDLARQAANPTTPHTESINKHISNIYSTPQNGHSSMGFDGYLTHPITPGGNSLMGNNHNMAKDCYGLPLRCPVTTTPHHHHASDYAPQQHYNRFVNQHGMKQ